MGNGLPRRNITDPAINDLLNNIRDHQTRRALEELIAEQYIVSSLPVWDDIRISAASAKILGQQNIPSFKQMVDDDAGSTGVYSLAFEDDELQQVFFEIQVPHRWLVGSDMELHVHWCTATGNAGNVALGLEYWKSGYRQSVDQATTVCALSAFPAIAVSHDQQISELCDIDMTGFKESSIILGRFWRDPTDDLDTLTGDMFLQSIDFHYQVNKQGTLTEYPI